MRYFKLLVNYIALLAAPIWGPIVVVIHNNEKHNWTDDGEFKERLKEIALCLIIPLVMISLMLLVKFMGLKKFQC